MHFDGVVRENPGGSFRPPSRDIDEARAAYLRIGNHWLRYEFARRFSEGKRLLDLGCGHGAGFLVLRGVCQEYVGVDVDSSAIEWAQGCFGNDSCKPTFVTADELRQNARLRNFDVVTSFETIEHVWNPRAHIEQARTLLRPGGILLLSTPNGTLSSHRKERFRTPYHIDEYSVHELSHLLDGYFDVVEYYGIYRADHLDSILHFVRCSFTPSSPNPSVQPKPRGAVYNTILGLFLARFNGVDFWRVRPLRTRSLDSKWFTTILAVCNRSPT